MESLLGVALLVWGAGGFLYKYFTAAPVTNSFLLQSIVSVVGGAYVLYPYALTLLQKTKKPKEDTTIDIPQHSCEEEYNDFKALHYLKDRALELNNQEALDLLVKLNTIMFASNRKN